MPVFDVLYDYRDKLKHILVRHEQGATHAAQGYARVSGKTGVVMVTSGPAATNIITGLSDAMMDSTPLIVNISAGTAEEYGELAAKLDVDGVAALEVNISCPNVKEGGIVFGTDPKAAASVARSVKDHTSKPVIMKLSPNVTDITVMAKAVEDAGADAVSLINTLTGMAIDIYTQKPLLGNITGGLSGPAVKPVALRMVWQVANAVKIPVLGLGGIASWQDAVEFMLAGASAVAVGAYNFVNPCAVEEIAEGMDAYCEMMGISHISEIIGKIND